MLLESISADWPDDLDIVKALFLWENNKPTNELLGDNHKAWEIVCII